MAKVKTKVKLTKKVVKIAKPAVKVVIKYKVDPRLQEILKYYQDAANYNVKNGVIPIMIDGGDLAREYVLKEEKEQQDVSDAVTLKTVAPKKGRPAKSTTKLIDSDEVDNPLIYKNLKKKEYRHPNTSNDIVEAKCAICNRMRKTPRSATERTIGGEPMDFKCDNCVANMRK